MPSGTDADTQQQKTDLLYLLHKSKKANTLTQVLYLLRK